MDCVHNYLVKHPDFSKSFICISKYLITNTADWRNANCKKENNRIGKIGSYIVTELVAIVCVPLSIIEGIFRSAISWLLYPFMVCLGESEPAWYDTHFVHVLKHTIESFVCSIHIACANINPIRKGMSELDPFTHFPTLYACFKLLGDG